MNAFIGHSFVIHSSFSPIDHSSYQFIISIHYIISIHLVADQYQIREELNTVARSIAHSRKRNINVFSLPTALELRWINNVTRPRI